MKTWQAGPVFPPEHDDASEEEARERANAEDQVLGEAIYGFAERLEAPPKYSHISEKTASERANPLISAEDQEWKEVLHYFKEVFESEESIGDIITQHFTKHESQLLVHSDHPHLKQLQDEDTLRYEKLIAGRFKDSEQAMASKMAMLYFGLPVEPIFSAMSLVASKMNHAGSDAPVYEAAKPLHFLTAHSQRNWGRIELAGREAPSYPVPIPQQSGPLVSLRGGEEMDVFEGGSDAVFGSECSYEATFPGHACSLYGFQGKALFGLEESSVASYAGAVARLLSLRSFEEAQYTLVRFNAVTGQVFDEVEDIAPVDENSAAWESAKLAGYLSFALFVKFSHEKTPVHWEPREKQFEVDVTKIQLQPHLEPQAGRLRADPAHPSPPCCYVSFPKMSSPFESLLSSWGANQYMPYVRTALEVIRGRPDEYIWQEFFSTYSYGTGDAIFFGLGSLEGFDLSELHPRIRYGSNYLTQGQPLQADELVFIVPHCCTNTQKAFRVQRPRTKNDRIFYPGVINVIREFVTERLSEENTQGLEFIRILSGRNTFDSDEVDRQQQELLVSMQDSKPGNVDDKLNELFEIYLDTSDPLIILYPVWDPLQSFMFATWVDASSSVDERAGYLPTLSSTAEQFRSSIRELASQTNSRPPDFAKEVISIKPCWESPDDAELSKFPTFYIDANTSDNEWFSIRAHITTRNAEVNIVEKKKHNWYHQIPKSNIWGPRYGLAAESRARWTDPEVRPVTQDKRGLTWAKQPSIFDKTSTADDPPTDGISEIPINAPPVEHVLRTTSSVPMVSKGVLTLTGQVELQKSLWDMRGLALSRIARCSYAGCDFTHRLDEPRAIAEHLQQEHLAQKCMLCDEPLFQWWDEERRMNHLVQNHRAQLVEALGLRRDVSFSNHEHKASKEGSELPSHEKVNMDGPGDFCNLCGRDRRTFGSDYERGYHDRHCKPGVLEHANCTFCTECGDYRWASPQDGLMSKRSPDGNNQCGHSETGARKFCYLCGIEYHRVLPNIHSLCCRGFGSIPGQFCARCGHDFRGIDFSEHVKECRQQQNPALVTSTRYENNDSAKGDRKKARLNYEPSYGPGIPAEGPSLWQPTSTLKAKSLSTSQHQISGISDGESSETDSSGTYFSETNSSEGMVGLQAHQHQALEISDIDSSEMDSSETDSSEDKVKSQAPRHQDVDPSGHDAPRHESNDDPTDAAPQGYIVVSESELSSFQIEDVPDERRRRAASPDWVQQLGPEDPDFQPNENYYCSKCLRKSPGKRERKQNSSLLTTVETQSHADKTLCCRIRNGIGDATNLPNRSGWIPAKKIKMIGKIKQNFLARYPAYARTLYPLHKQHYYQSRWASDPNNGDNQDWWGIPWPPYEGQPPFPGGWDAMPENDSEDGRTGGKRSSSNLKPPVDTNYQYHSSEDSADDLQPDVDDLHAKKRKRPADATFKPSSEQKSGDEADTSSPIHKKSAKKRQKRPAAGE